MRRVLIYRNDLLPASETFIANQAAALTRYSPWFAGLRRIADGLPLDLNHVCSLTTESHLKDKLLRRAYLYSGLAPGFHRRLYTLHPSLIHAHFAVDACAALPVQQSLRVPLVITLHGYDVMRSDQALAQTLEGRVYLSRRAVMLRQAALFICVSEHVRRHAVDRGFPAEKLIVLRIGVEVPGGDIGSASYQEPEPIVLFVGRMVEKKGCIYLLRAMERVMANRPGVRLILLGDGPLRSELELEAKACLPCATFLGMQPPCEVRRWMQRARVLAAPSIVASDGDAEGLPTVLCEAQAIGLPVVAFHGSGIDEAVVGNETALLVAPKNEQAMSDAILLLLRDCTLHSRFAVAGRKRAAEHFDIRRQTALLEDQYDKVLSRHKRAET
jgi:glycosyltransferase involved in cell wall biosynthesis